MTASDHQEALMRVMVTGSRSWRDIDAVAETLSFLTRDDTLIHGGCHGADEIAGAVARDLGATIEVWPADWARYGRAAGPKRNIAMLNSRPHRVIAFWDGSSRGTKSAVEGALRRLIPTTIIRSDT